MIEAVINCLDLKLRPVLPAGVGLYGYPGPKAKQPVAVIHKFINGQADYFLGNVERSVDIVVEVAVEAVSETISPVQEMADLMHRTIMSIRSFSTEYGIVADVFRMTPVNYPIDLNGKTLQHLGGIYKFNVRPLPPE